MAHMDQQIEKADVEIRILKLKLEAGARPFKRHFGSWCHSALEKHVHCFAQARINGWLMGMFLSLGRQMIDFRFFWKLSDVGKKVLRS